MEIQKPPCEFGTRCYRKNPKHFESYSHPDKLKVEENILARSKKNVKDETIKGRMKQTTLEFTKNCDSSSTKREAVDNAVNSAISPNKNTGPSSLKKNVDKAKPNMFLNRKRKKKITRNIKIETHKKKAKTIRCFKTSDHESDDDSSSVNGESVPSTSWVFIKNELKEKNILTNSPKSSLGFLNLKNESAEEIIKTLFLVNMPSDFYSFYEFCKSLNEIDLKTFQLGELKLVGPFNVLFGDLNYSLDPDLYLCHWRFFYDPPEFQTVLAAETGFHIGYWRDDPKENPVFLASNNPSKGYLFKTEAGNIFGAVFHYLSEYIKACDPFKRVKAGKLQTALGEWAKRNKFSLDKKTSEMCTRQKKVVSKTFHGAGIVVPVETKTQLGYRPLIETDSNLKKICKLIMKANDETEKEALWENLQPLITAANIANDECDFGNSLELGIDLFCMGSPVFHESVEHLLSTAYSLLNRTEFEKIIKAHLKFRRKSIHLSVNV